MILKYKIYVEGFPIGLRWARGVVTIGGYLKSALFIDDIVSSYFLNGVVPLDWRATQRNKGKYVFSLSKVEFMEALAQMRKHHLAIEAVDALGRLW